MRRWWRYWGTLSWVEIVFGWGLRYKFKATWLVVNLVITLSMLDSFILFFFSVDRLPSSFRKSILSFYIKFRNKNLCHMSNKLVWSPYQTPAYFDSEVCILNFRPIWYEAQVLRFFAFLRAKHKNCTPTEPTKPFKLKWVELFVLSNIRKN